MRNRLVLVDFNPIGFLPAVGSIVFTKFIIFFMYFTRVLIAHFNKPSRFCDLAGVFGALSPTPKTGVVRGVIPISGGCFVNLR